MAALNIWYGWDGLNVWLFELGQQFRSPTLEPALVLVSVFGSFWLAPYYGRIIGAQALRIVRCPDRHTIVGCRLVSGWEVVFFRYLLATALAAALVWVLLARRNRSVVNQNLALSAVVIDLLVVGAVAGLLNLPAAVLAHEISEFVVIASGLRMLKA